MTTNLSIQKNLAGEQGSSMMYAVLFVMMMGYMGTAMINVVTAEDENSGNNTWSQKNFYVGHAGLEFASYFIRDGVNIDNESRHFEDGDFSLYTNPVEGLATVHSQMKKADKIQKITSDFAQQCLRVDTTSATVTNNHLSGVRIWLDCPENTAVVEKMGLDWDVIPTLPSDPIPADAECPPEAASPTNYADYVDPEDSSRIIICHLPSQNRTWSRTESITIEQWKHSHHEGFAGHGMDYLGACNDQESAQQIASFCYEPEDDMGTDGGNRDPAFSDEQHRAGLSLTHIDLSNNDITRFYDGMGGVGLPVMSAGPNQAIDGDDFTMTGTTSYLLDFTFTDDMPAGLVNYWVTLIFADGSERAYGFQISS